VCLDMIILAIDTGGPGRASGEKAGEGATKIKLIIRAEFSYPGKGVSAKKRRHTGMVETSTTLPHVVLLLVRRGRGHPPTPLSLGYRQRVQVVLAEGWKCG